MKHLGVVADDHGQREHSEVLGQLGGGEGDQENTTIIPTPIRPTRAAGVRRGFFLISSRMPCSQGRGSFLRGPDI